MSGFEVLRVFARTPVGRREFLRAGAAATGGLTLENGKPLFAGASGLADGDGPTAVIQIMMGGGPSHLDMYDLKPDAPREIRGEFHSIPTNVPDIRICEHLPHQARVMDKLAIVRTVHHDNASHLPASHFVMTGHNPPTATTKNINPSAGSVVAKLRGSNKAGMPGYVGIPRKQLLGGAGFLGAAWNPFTPESDPSKPDFAVLNLTLPAGMTRARIQDRRALMTSFDRLRWDVDARNEFEGLDRFSREAAEMVIGENAARAFDLTQEDRRTRDRYGPFSAGQGCLLARRLVEAGVTFVTVLSGGGWDTHTDNFNILKTDCLPRVDQAIAALVTDLYERGLDRRVMVVAFGEFGRTPQINANGGRDHWPGASFALFSGGGIRTGRMIGETDATASFPITRRYSPGDVLATVYRFLKINPRHEFRDETQQRPIPVLAGGEPIEELFG